MSGIHSHIAQSLVTLPRGLAGVCVHQTQVLSALEPKTFVYGDEDRQGMN